MPNALPFDPYKGAIWRLVENQFRASTMRIVDSLEEQVLLETLLDDTKPPVPEACQHLHYLLAAPFRYGCYPKNSRFRRKGRTAGVLYGAEHLPTAIAEHIWGKIAFFRASVGTPWPQAPVQHTAFAIDVQHARAIDLTVPPMQDSEAYWQHPSDYAYCLDLADQVRDADGGIIRYASVRDPEHRPNIAVLTCQAFRKTAPRDFHIWHILYRATRIRATREFGTEAHEFSPAETQLVRAE